MDADAHLVEHLLHRRTHVTGHDACDVMVGQESGDARVVLVVVGRVVRLVPADFEFISSGDPRIAKFDDRDAVGTTPAVADLAVCGYWQTDDHEAAPRATRPIRAVDGRTDDAKNGLT